MQLDLTVTGMAEAQRKFLVLANIATKPMFRKALRDSIKRIHKRLIDKVSGFPVGVVTGDYRRKIKRSTPRVGRTRSMRKEYQMVIPRLKDPQDAIKQISLEYGHVWGVTSERAVAHPHIRPAVDEKKRSEILLMARDMGRAIEKEAAEARGVAPAFGGRAWPRR